MKQIELQRDSDGSLYADLTVSVKILRDDDPPSYLDDFDRLGTILYGHRRYRLGDVEITGLVDLFVQVLGEDEVTRILKISPDWATREDLENPRLWAALDDAAVYLPVYLYDHSGISVSTRSFIGRAHHASWDSGQVGWIVATKEEIRENFMVKRVTRKIRERTEEVLKGEIETFDTYLRGNIWGYTLTVETDEEGEYHDSCWGFYGDPDGYILDEVNARLEKFGLQAVK